MSFLQTIPKIDVDDDFEIPDDEIQLEKRTATLKRSGGRTGERGGERYMGVGDHEDDFDYIEQPELSFDDFKINI